MKSYIIISIILCLALPAYAQKKTFSIPLRKVDIFNQLHSYMALQPISNLRNQFKLPKEVSENYILKSVDLQPAQTLYTDYLSGYISKEVLLAELKNRNIDTSSLSHKVIKSSMGILIYRQSNKLCYIFDTDLDKNFTNNIRYSFDEDSLLRYPKIFKAAIKVTPVLEFFYSGKKYKEPILFFFHPAKFGNISYNDPKQDSLYILVSIDNIYRAKLPDGGYLYVLNFLPIKKFSWLSHYYVGNADSVFTDKNYELHNIILSNKKFYRIDSSSINMDKIYLTYASTNSIGGEVGLFSPKLEMTDMDGNKIQSGNKQKYLFLDFMGTWCGPCIAALPALKDIFNGLNKNAPIEFISVAVEHEINKEKFSKFLKDHSIPWHVVYQPASLATKLMKSIQLLGVQGYPTYILLDPKGRIIFRGDNESLPELKNILNAIRK